MRRIGLQRRQRGAQVGLVRIGCLAGQQPEQRGGKAVDVGRGTDARWIMALFRRHELDRAEQGARIGQPSLFIAGSNDAVVTGLMGGKRIADMERVLPNLKQKLIVDGAGHWIQQERPAEVNAALIAFLREVSR